MYSIEGQVISIYNEMYSVNDVINALIIYSNAVAKICVSVWRNVISKGS